MSLAIAVAAVGLVGLNWEDRAEDICREEAPRTARDYSVKWEWDEFAYVCDYRSRGVRPKRVGIVDAFHGDDRRPHPGP